VTLDEHQDKPAQWLHDAGELQHVGTARPTIAMNMLHLNIFWLTFGCGLLLIGFSGRKYRWGPGVMLVGIIGVLGMIGYNIYQLLYHP
jgi:hypothetical protein